MHVYVYDDDIFGYRFYRDAKLIDEYNSDPDYFEEQPAEEEARLRGRPEVFAEFIPTERDRQGLQELLSPEYAENVIIASETLERFARLLGLTNAVAAYEYLQDGETEDITDWDRFVHVPDRAEELSRKAKIQNALEAEKQRLKSAGLLLASRLGALTPVVNSRLKLFTNPVVCADRQHGSLLACWAEVSGNQFHAIERWGPPWDKAPTLLDLKIQDSVHALALSPSGRYLAVGHSFGNSRAQLFDFERQALIAGIPHSRFAEWVGFHRDEKYVVSVGEDEAVVTSVAGARVSSVRVPRAESAVIHASGVLVLGSRQGVLSLADLPSGRVIKSLEFIIDTAPRQPLYEGVSSDPNFLQAMERAQEYLQKQFEERGLEQGESVRKAEEEIRQAREMAAGRLIVPESIYSLDASPDGKLLFAGTSGGARVFAWEGVLRAEDRMPPPLFVASGTPVARLGLPPAAGAMVYALAHDDPGNRLVFAGLDGVVSMLDLATGKTSVILRPPGQPATTRLVLSRDARTLCVVRLSLGNGEGAEPSELQIWDYVALLNRSAGGQ